jgi:hypothetical protein
MKKILTLVLGIVGFGMLFSFLSADTGHEGATRIERGSYVQTRRVTISDSAATAFITATNRRPDTMCKNYTAFTVFIGSAAAGTTLNLIGLPLGAGEYFKVDGSFTG